ncbi:hypothetical protein FHS43_003254 [Streptosporangium becharense]|uniref:Uncharacterized protein n=1 Tax=Streptosporangium becharense TaxID=1816182 RepID=A0A7W9IDM3_9ACTN|nr:hypothetical protein [Streptosporangium becharense]MBB2911974.1 hypothetical protein [Streptosporangium becharense]MBB5818521.1 hypothetical protein [Streptosporangium becharense]
MEVRVRNAVSQGSAPITGQVIDSPAPLAEMLRELATLPPDDPTRTPRTACAARVKPRRCRRPRPWPRRSGTPPACR